MQKLVGLYRVYDEAVQQSQKHVPLPVRRFDATTMPIQDHYGYIGGHKMAIGVAQHLPANQMLNVQATKDQS